MRSFTKIILAAVLFAVSSGLASADPTLKVHIQKETTPGVYVGVGSVTVAAIEFGMNGPSTYTQVGLTNASGDAYFDLSSGTYGRSYNLYYSSHAFSPSIADQFNNPEYDPNRYIWAMNSQAYFSTFTVTADTSDLGRLVQEFTGATANKVLFGGVYNMTTQMQGGSGIVFTGAGSGTLVVDNVPFADANTYNIGLYDPEKNKGIGRNVMSALDATAPLVMGVRTVSYLAANNAALDFNQAVPPARVENTSKPGETSNTGASVEGVLMSTNSAAIGNMGIEVKACGGSYNWQTWAHADQNGRFQLYGLTPGVTYYLKIMGGCTWGQDQQESKCYEPYSSPNFSLNDMCTVDNSLATSNDIVYGVAGSSDVVYKTITLNEMPKSIGQIRVYVKSTTGTPIPNSNVNISPDGSPWPNTPTSCQSTNFFNNYSSSAGFSNANVNASATGYALLDGLPSGNYTLYVHTPFSNNSGGPSAPFNGNGDDFTSFGMNGGGGMDWTQAHCTGTGVNDYRITITTWTTPSFHVYNSSGSVLQYDINGNLVSDGSGVVDVSSITYLVAAGTASMTGVVSGTLRFPGIADLSNNPITISLFAQCMNMGPGGSCPAGNLWPEVRSGASSYDYSINVSSGYSYYMNVTASGWGRINRGGGNNTINLQSSSFSVVNMDFAPAGTIRGTVYKPGGTEILTPSSNQWIWIDAGTNNSWTGTQLQKDGTFEMTDVLPGVNRISMNVSGGGGSSTFNYTLPMPQPTVTVTAGSESTINLTLVKSNYVGINVNMNKLPDNSVLMDGREAILGYKVIPLPAGTVLKGETISKMLTGGDEEGMRISYSTATGMGEEGRCGQGWPGGFCATAFPSPSIYDFYLMRSGDFAKSTSTAVNAPYPHFTLISSSKNVIIDDAHAINLVRPAMSMSFSTGVAVNLTPRVSGQGPGGPGLSLRGNATLRGSVSASNFFRQSDYDATGGDFEAFVKYLPVVSLYDANGGFAAAGVVLPPPSYISAHDQEFDSSFAQSYTAFKTLLDGAGAYGYEIRTLAPSTCYTAVLTTPNYPPYQTQACMGVSGTTTTISVNMDTAVGAGATLTGVVTSTATGLVLANAVVQVAGESVDARSVVTNSSGVYKFEGLSPGTLRIKVSLGGYALGEGEEDLVGSNTYPRNFALFPAGGSITGTVYSQKLPFAKTKPDAIIVAYDDTYNGNNPTAPLPLIKTKTDADGNYKLEGLIPGDTYKVFLKVPGKYTLNQSVVATAGIVPDIDFTMLTKPLDIEIFAKKGADAFEFTVLNPQDFKQGQARWSAAPYSAGASTELNLEKMSSGELRGRIPLTSLTAGITYELQGNATSYSNKTVTRTLLFGTDYKGNADQHIDDAIIGDDSDDGFGRKSNEAPMDKSGDNASALMFPAGGILPVSSAAVPTCSFKGEDKDSSAVADKVAALGADAFAGDLYTVALTSVSINPDKGFEITLAYDKSTADLTDLSVARYNDTTSEWENVPGVATINPVKGTVKVKLKSLASVLAVKNGSARPQFSSFNGREYVVRPMAGGSSSSAGTFAVVRPSLAGNAFAGNKVKVFNYPNPFNLKDKAISNLNGATLPGTVNGTVIHVEVPAGNGGPGHVRIYTLAGELVKDISVTFEDGKYNYVGWDGHNAGGQEVANGVYYGVVEMSGKSVNRKDATFKMAVIK